jgi:hypothetical protein
MTDLSSINPMLIPIVGTVFGTVMIVAIVGIVFWFKARERELQVHQEMRIREMEHQRKMKELELEIEKTRSRQTPPSKLRCGNTRRSRRTTMLFNNVVEMIARNGLWVMIIAVVAIGSWVKYREHELKVHEDLRIREMEHEREMKKLEVDLEKAKARQDTEKVV